MPGACLPWPSLLLVLLWLPASAASLGVVDAAASLATEMEATVSKANDQAGSVTITSPPSGYTLKPLKEGLKCNTDRDFKITTVPSSLQDASVLVGPLYFEAGGTMSFSTSVPTIVYLAVESGTPCIPCLKNSNKWTKTGEVLVVGSMRYPIYSRTFGSTSVKIEYSKEGLGAYLNHGHQNLVIITPAPTTPAPTSGPGTKCAIPMKGGDLVAAPFGCMEGYPYKTETGYEDGAKCPSGTARAGQNKQRAKWTQPTDFFPRNLYPIDKRANETWGRRTRFGRCKKCKDTVVREMPTSSNSRVKSFYPNSRDNPGGIWKWVYEYGPDEKECGCAGCPPGQEFRGLFQNFDFTPRSRTEGSYSPDGKDWYYCADQGKDVGVRLSPMSMDFMRIGECTGVPVQPPQLTVKSADSVIKDLYTTHYENLKTSERWNIACRTWKAVLCHIVEKSKRRCIVQKVLKFISATETRSHKALVKSLEDAKKYKYLRTMHEEAGLCSLVAMTA